MAEVESEAEPETGDAAEALLTDGDGADSMAEEDAAPEEPDSADDVETP